ncbi:hypothetical protein RRG08_032773 [Elysia crispata]|uniref:MYND-type domain-containing protein n=1 Tax=Elysia crispata TaxID=231223 RepID=A0AAE1D1S2_9GAST|nr:hypothetical protein RRG08_032773 [Elysia crispata]
MATSRRRRTFKDFYGDLEHEEKGYATATCDEMQSSASGQDKYSSKGDSFRKSKRSSGGDGTSGKIKTSSGGDSTSGKSKTPSGGDGTSGKSKGSSESGKSKTPHSESGSSNTNNIFSESINFDDAKISYSSHTFDENLDGHNDDAEEKMLTSHTFETHTEWLGGPAPRQYRREKFLAEKMPSIICEDGAKVKRSDTDVLSKPSTICNLCRKTSPEPLKRCARCLAVSYCSKDCQRCDFMNHKMFCRRCDRYDIARARVYPAVRFFLDFRHPRDYSVLLADMPTEQQYQCGIWCNILVEMLGQIPHFCRHICLVRDLSGRVTKVVFHDEKNLYIHPSLSVMQSLPHSLNSCLIPGNFLLLVGVHWRNFHDGTVGIRVNDLFCAYFINMADHPFSRDYKENVEHIVSNYDDSPRLPSFPSFWF